MEQKYLKAVLKKDVKLGNFISNILNFEPASDIDESNEINPESSTSCDDVIDKSDEQVSIVSLNTTTTEDDPELTCYFAEPNDKERECVAAHIKRFKRELKESTTKRNRQQMTGRAVVVGNSVENVMKLKRHRRGKLQQKKD